MMHAATTKNAADDGSPGTSSSNGVGRTGGHAHRTVVDPGHRHAERREHPLGVIAARRGLDTISVAPSACSPASSSAVFTCALGDRRARAGPREARHRGRRSAAACRRRGRRARAHRAQRLDDARHRPRRQRRVAGQHREERPAREQPGEHAHRRAGVPAVEHAPPARASPSTPRPPTVTRSPRSPEPTPSCAERARSRATSAPSPRGLVISARPSASAANSSARCEIDLSPGRRSRPVQRRGATDDELVGPRRAHASRSGDVVAERRAGPALERVGAGRGDDEHEHTRAALERVRDLDVGRC